MICVTRICRSLYIDLAQRNQVLSHIYSKPKGFSLRGCSQNSRSFFMEQWMRNRRVVSAPLTKTPRTRSPLPDFNAAEDVQRLPPSCEFTITMSMPHMGKFSPEHPNSQTLYRQIIHNLRQFQALAVITLEDLHSLFGKHPFHTVYFFSKAATADILRFFFRFFHDIWYGAEQKECNIPNNNLRTKDNPLARQLVEIILWWYSAWRWRLELEGNVSLLNTIWSKLIVLTGKGSGDIKWRAERGSYWPFKSRDKAFAFLELEFSSPLWRKEPFLIMLSSLNHEVFLLDNFLKMS